MKIRPSLIIKLIYLRRFFSHFIFIWSVDKIFFSQRGMNPFEITLLLGIWSAFTIVFEVPSGAIADRWSRKWLIVISSLFWAAAYFTWIFSFSFWSLALGYILMGVGSVLGSGTKEAFLYDHLKAQGREDEFEKCTGRIWVITTVSFLITALVAGWLADRFSFVLVLGLSIFSCLFAGVVASLIPDTPKLESTEEISYWRFFIQAWKKAFKQPVLVRALIYAATIEAAYASLDEVDQLYVSSLGLPIKLFGIWWLIRMTGEGLAGLVAHKFKRFDVQKLLTLIALINAIILFVSAFVSSYVMLPILGLMYGFFSVALILNSGILQKQIDSHERATITSISGFLVDSVAIVVGLAFGYLANRTNPRIGFVTFGVLILVYFATRTVIKGLRRLKFHTVRV